MRHLFDVLTIISTAIVPLSPAAAQTKVVITASSESLFHAPIYTAQELGYFKQQNLVVVPDDKKKEEPKEEIPFLVGQAVAITEGPFTDFNGTVEEVMADKGKVRVSVSLFGRPTSVELDYLQLKGY